MGSFRGDESVEGFADVCSAFHAQRGGFAVIEDRRVDLALQPQCHPLAWLPLIDSIWRPSLESTRGGMLRSFWRITKNLGRRFPPPSVVAPPGHNERVISRASLNGMIFWEPCAREPSRRAELLYIVTVSSFSVVKDEDSDRLISWPRLQNL